MAPKKEPKTEPKQTEEEAEEAAEEVEEAAAEEAVTASEDVTIEQLPGGGTREFPASKRRYS